jgi:tetratricopeptide (TPR) repeat protein
LIALITNTENASDQVAIGAAYMRLGDYGEALAHYQNALSMTPNSKVVQQKISEARDGEVAKESGLINRERASIAIRRGDTYLVAGAYDQAIYSFEAALKSTPGNREVRERLQRALRARAAEEAVLR